MRSVRLSFWAADFVSLGRHAKNPIDIHTVQET